MNKALTVGKKVGFGFAGLIVIMASLGLVAVTNMRKVQGGAEQLSTEFIPEARLAGKLNDLVGDVQLAVRSYGLTADPKYAEQVHANLDRLVAQVTAANKFSAEHPQLVKLRAHLADIDVSLKGYAASITETEAKNRELIDGREKLNAAASDFIGNIDKIIEAQNVRLDKEIRSFAEVEKVINRHEKIELAQEIRGQGNAARIAVFKAQALRKPELIEEGLKGFEEMDRHFTRLLGMLKVQADVDEVNQAAAAAHRYRDNMKRLHENLMALEEIAKRRMVLADKLGDLATETSEAGMQRSVDSSQESIEVLSFASNSILIGLVVALVLGVVVAAYIVLSMKRSINQVTLSLQSGSERIVSAASQVTSASTSLAEGASEQAASLEETSASIEEMASMTKRNAQSALSAKTLANEARTVADGGAASMGRMTRAMEEMKTSNGEISKIIKTIDEISFQTNILALNAAVEAARAGEAGAGFAVVADEVRSLAQRCAIAAKETAQKIEHALAKSQEGVVISGEVAATLGGIIERVRKVDELIAEIAQASNEQSEGITQINTAVVQMDKVTQGNAAAAEESAAAANELNSQADELHTMVAQLKALTGT